MKAVFIIFNQAITNKVEKALELAQIKGFSKWNEMVGAGSNEGEPHLGTHVWPSLNSGIFTVLEDEKVKTLLNLIEQINNRTRQLQMWIQVTRRIADEQGF